MKKLILAAFAAVAMISASAQNLYEQPKFDHNWSIGLDGGVTTPLVNHAFFGSMRGSFGVHLQKQITPSFALGFEGVWGVNTSSWGVKRYTAIDDTYVGAYGSLNLMNLLGGFRCESRVFEIELTAGAGWGHDHNIDGVYNDRDFDQNYFVTKAGVNFLFNVNKHITLSLKPSVSWNMTGRPETPLTVSQTSCAYDAHQARFNCLVGLSYHFGPRFQCVGAQDQAEIDMLNAKINEMKAELDVCLAGVAAKEAAVAVLAAELDACLSRKPEVIREVTNNLSSVRFVFFQIGQSKITADQQPNLEMIADYLKNHPASKVIVKGYASKDGKLDWNLKLAANRAEAVKAMLIKKYGIAADRIEAKGEGIGEMFAEESWNRVAICTLD